MIALLVGSAGIARAEPGVSLAAHVLSRTAYGPDAWSLVRIATLGVDAYLEEQLHPADIPDDALAARLAGYPTLALELAELRSAYAEQTSLPLQDLMRARLIRSVVSHRQLEQVLVDFWFDHFNVYGGHAYTSLALGPYERGAIRPYVLGRFGHMLRAVARHGAMLVYLSNDLNRKQGFVYEGKRYGLNENFARELLELHTVGAAAGFTQADVIAAARSFTGWTKADPPLGAIDGFHFWGLAHDDDAKRVMGLSLPAGGGVRDGLGVLEYLAAHPATASHVCEKLVVRFVSEAPPARLVDECAQVFRSTDGDLRAVIHAILFSPEFRDPAYRGVKVKRPLVFAASLLRATRTPLSTDGIVNWTIVQLERLGEALYLARPPDGHPDLSSHWIAGNTLLGRADWVARFTAVGPQLGIEWGMAPASASMLVDGLAARLLVGPPSAATRDAVIARIEQLGSAPAAARVREAVALLLTSPEFMRH